MLSKFEELGEEITYYKGNTIEIFFYDYSWEVLLLDKKLRSGRTEKLDSMNQK